MQHESNYSVTKIDSNLYFLNTLKAVKTHLQQTLLTNNTSHGVLQTLTRRKQTE